MEAIDPFQVASVAIGFFFLSLTTAHLFSVHPIDRLGKRPIGRGLWTYFYSQVWSSTAGVWGYDSSLGSFNPVWRVSFHISALMLCYSFMLFFVHGNAVEVLFAVICAYCGVYFVLYTYGKGVSHPGGPREHKIRRMAEWNDKESNVDHLLTDNGETWRCVVASESHRATLQTFHLTSEDGENGIRSGLIGMSGEPFGRQIWVKDNHGLANLNKKQLDVVREMACAGRNGFNASKNPNTGDIIFRKQMISNYIAKGGDLPDSKTKPKTVKEAARKAVHFYSMLQCDDGHWAGDYGGPHFLMPGLIIAWYVMGKPSEMINDSQCQLMSHYLTVHQQADGGWGTHIESPSTMFGTVLCYVSLRLLGTQSDNENMIKARTFIQNEGGAIMTSSWAKFWLCILGCMEWTGHNSVPPEMWLLPNWFPFHPGRLWCHCRMVYLPMGYIYGAKFVYDNAETDPLVLALRKELYCEDYQSIQWNKTRSMVADMDNYSPLPLTMKLAQNMLAFYETFFLFQPFKNFVRRKGLAFCADYMAAEDLQTNFIDIGPVNKVLNMVAAFREAGNNISHATVKNHMMRIPDYLWIAEDGMKMQGYNGSQCWDTSFAIQAISECNLLDEFPDLSRKVWSYLERTQILSTEDSQSSPAFKYESVDNRNKYFRHVSLGGWPFSTSAHGWPISDCTGEGLKGVAVLLKSKVIQQGIKDGSLRDIPLDRLQVRFGDLYLYVVYIILVFTIAPFDRMRSMLSLLFKMKMVDGLHMKIIADLVGMSN